MQKAEKRLQLILHKYRNCGISEKYYCKLDINKNPLDIKFLPKKKIGLILSFSLITLAAVFLLKNPLELGQSKSCLIEMPSEASKWFREPETCSICDGVADIQKIKNITPSTFLKLIEASTPFVVTDGAKNWPAVEVFDFEFFKNLYQTDDDESNCQFFPYKTEFKSLREVLSMDPKRANLEQGQKSWYIGWSNCNDEAGKILRDHYDVPYFLPNTSENIALNWIFMGSPGHGAHMHVDNVQYPSWQAQLKGKKLWRLAPPPECYYKCQEVQVTVETGEIIVVDTNRWYHQTFILPGEISITIGAEFD